jgi:hypothetical protein
MARNLRIEREGMMPARDCPFLQKQDGKAVVKGCGPLALPERCAL